MTSLDTEDIDLVVLLATSSASLDRSPKKNWVENAGSLPPYIRKLARAIEKDGKSLSQAIAIAISRVKKWAAGGDGVEADTKTKAAKALAQWTALKAKNKAKQIVKASREDGSEYLLLSDVGEFDTEIVRTAWDEQSRLARARRREASPDTAYDEPYYYVKSVWTTFIIIQGDGRASSLFKIPYTVEDGTRVRFGSPVAVKTAYVEEEWDADWSASDLDEDLSSNETLLLADLRKTGA